MAIKTVSVLLAGALLAATPPLPERVIPEGGIVAIIIDGVAGKLRADPAAPGVPLISADWAQRAGMKPRALGFGLGYAVGPVGAYHATKVAKLDLGQGVFERRVGWGKRPYSPVGEGVIGPAALPDPVIRFVLREAQAGERQVSLPMVDGGGLFGRFSGLFGQIQVAGAPMRVRFDPYHPRTVANAAAGVRIAGAQGGELVGTVSDIEIAFGIERPVRRMELARPLTIGPLAIAALGVRTVDGGSTAGIAEQDAPKPDPDEIVVTAKGKKHDPDRDRLSIGADVLDRCSSIVFDKPTKQIRLSCR